MKPTLTIKVGEDEFVLRVPSVMDKARIGMSEASLRRSLDPAGIGFGPIDDDTYCLIRGMAVLTSLLDQSSAKWVWTRRDNKLVVDPEQFPAGKEDVVAEVGRQFQDALDRFHGKGVGHAAAPVSEAVDGVGNPGAL